MTWRAEQDRDAFKEAWLLFENVDRRFPLYPGETAWIDYAYTVQAYKWGSRWERAIRLPTRRLSMTATFPARLKPTVWGSMTSMTADGVPLHTPISCQHKDDQMVFTWSTDDPQLHARYRIEWKLTVPDETEKTGADTLSPAGRMRSPVIARERNPVLAEVALPISLPAEAAHGRRVVSRLANSVERIALARNPAEGISRAAPKIENPIAPGLGAIRAALDSAELPPDGPVRPLSDLTTVVAETVRLRLTSNYLRLSAGLPGLLDELHRAYDSSAGQRRSAAAALLTQAYRAADALADKFGEHDLSARIIAMLLDTARQSGNEVVLATASYVRGELFFANGRPDLGRELLERAAERLVPGADPGASAAYGALHMRAAVLARQAGQLTGARDHLAEAAEYARLVPEGEYCGTAFGPSSVRIHEVTLAVDVGDLDGALRAARNWDPPNDLPGERRSHFYVDLARARAQLGSVNETVTALFQARAVAPEHTRVHPQVRQILSELLQQPGATGQLREFAQWTKLPPSVS